MKISEEDLKQILLGESYISEEDLNNAEQFVSEHENTSFVDYILNKEILTDDLLGQAVAESFSMSYFDLNDNPPSNELFESIPREEIENLRVVPALETEDRIKVATDKPDRLGLKQKVQEYFDKEVLLVYTLGKEIDEILNSYGENLEDVIQEIISEKSTDIAAEIHRVVLDRALERRASDIHYEPRQNDRVAIRMRIDGVLHKVAEIPEKYYKNLLNYIKITANLRIDERQRPQDGSIRHKDGDKEVDMRVSIAPVMEGEKVVLRLLAEYMRDFTINGLGLSERNKRLLKESGDKPFGMILVSGPTGSGKTTTLYSLVKLINEVDVNITTIEDPVEYRIDNVNQIQVKPDLGLTFATGLRTIVRQDPDTILVGEIRDEETSEIAVNSALTGHLMLSTFHANDAATTIPRLLDMNVEPYLLASTLEVIIAQRLIRKICKKCRHSTTVAKDDIEKEHGKLVASHFEEEKVTIYEGKGCNLCDQTGYNGRVGVFEFVNVTPEVEDIILNNPSKKEIWKQAEEQGAKSMFSDGIRKVKNGITTIEEVTRVTSPNEY